MIRRPGFRRALAAVWLLLPPGALQAQQTGIPQLTVPRPGIEAVRLHLGIMPLLPLVGPQEGPDTALSLNGRAVLGMHINPQLSAYVAAMRVAPTGLELWGGMAGGRYTMGTGRLRVGGFLEAGYGELKGFRSAGLVEFLDSTGAWHREPRVPYRSARLPGGGAGVEAEYALGNSVLLKASAGYWRFTQDGFGIRHILGGLGITFAHRDEPWYWLKKGDPRPPTLAVLNPRADTIDAYDPHRDPLTIVASALSGIATIEVDGAPVEFLKVVPEGMETRTRGEAVVASIPLGIAAGSSQTVHLATEDRLGNRSEQTVLVLGPVVDREPPILASPNGVANVLESPALLVGYIMDRSPLTRVLVGGMPTKVDPIHPQSVAEQFDVPRGMRVFRFTAAVDLKDAREADVLVVATDSLGHRSETGITVIRREAVGPYVKVFHPDTASLTSEEISVMGGVAHWSPLRVVMVGAEPAELREVDVTEVFPEHAGPGMRAYLFEARVPLDIRSNQITILARDAEGFQTVLTLRVTRVPERRPQ